MQIQLILGGKLVWKPSFLLAGANKFKEKKIFSKVLRNPSSIPFNRPVPHFLETGFEDEDGLLTFHPPKNKGIRVNFVLTG
jgi:hypothetical protein